jgi:methionyl-tRNA synthetase
LQADAYARYFRNKLGKEKVFFNIGLDEHGLKILTTATKTGLTPEGLLNKLLPGWIDFCSAFNITYDYFYRTSSGKHHEGASRIWQLCDAKGDIYKKFYKGLYCIGCESFLHPRELKDGKCPHHNTEPIEHAEENYFFRLSKYADQIIQHINSNPEFLKPASKRAELLNFLKSMEDISISRNRKNLPWGITVPGDPDHTIYVWFDALTNYILSAGFGSEPDRFDQFWPGIQLCGPDNLRFQGAIWI